MPCDRVEPVSLDDGSSIWKSICGSRCFYSKWRGGFGLAIGGGGGFGSGNKLNISILAGNIGSFNCLEAFFVHHIQSWLASFAVKIFDDFFECLDHEYIGMAYHWADDDGIVVI